MNTKTTERPILFSAPMVRAILTGRKTQTRRVVRWPFKGQPRDEELDNLGDGQSLYVRGKAVPCPYGIDGDRLWVRETWAHSGADKRRALIYRADEGTASLALQAPEFGKWRPSIFMPRSACRIVLEVIDMRCERLQAISYEDALAEGAPDFAEMLSKVPEEQRESKAYGETLEQCARRLQWPQRWYRQLWESLNAKRGFAWKSNPWVWVMEFKRV